MKKQVKNVSPWKLGALASLSLILFLVFACSEDSLQETQAITEQSSSALSDVDGEVFTFVEEVPSYPGGMDALYHYVSSEIRYPKEARSQGIEGRVMVEFVVEKDGAISNVRAIEGIGAGCDQEAVRVVENASAFTPGSQRGKKVRVRMVMPILFKLDPVKTNPDNSAQGLVIVEQVESKNGKLKVNASYNAGAWSGTIYSPEDDVLPGANIIVTGTTSGTVSDLDGTFTLKASETQDIQVSFVGYESVRLLGKANRKTN